MGSFQLRRPVLTLFSMGHLVKGTVRGGLAYPQQNTRAQDFYTNQRPDLPYRLLDRDAINLSDKNNFAPRIGLAYSPTGGGKTVIRLGYGWYYGQTELMDLINDSLSNPPSAQWPTLRREPWSAELELQRRSFD